MAKKVYLFADGNWSLHRAWYASGRKSKFPEVKVPNLILQWYCEAAVRLEARYGAICFDGPRNFRKKLYPEYKLNRADTEETELLETVYWKGKLIAPRTEKDMINALIEPTIALFKKHGIVAEQQQTREADDLCLSAAHKVTIADAEAIAYVMSLDKDFFQGVNEQISVFMPAMKPIPERIWTPAKVLKVKKMTPRQFLNYQILIGDGIDNVPPIPEIGTAAKALAIVKEHDKLSEYFEGTKEGKRIYRKYVTELHRNRQMVTMDKKCWTIANVKLQPTGSNPDVPGLAALKSFMSKKSLFG